MELITLCVPVVVTGILFGVKKLAGLALFANGAEARPFLRFALILFSLLGIVSTSLIMGTEINPDSISTLVSMALQTLLSAYVSHLIYTAVRNVMGR